MFPANKPLPPPPLPEKPSWKSKDNASEASAPAAALRLHSQSAIVMHSLPSTNYSPTVADYVHRRVLRQAIAAICKQAGFETIEADVLELLTHMINSYINELAITTRQMTEHAGRTISTPSDTIIALVDLGTAVSDLPAFLKEATSKGSLVIAPPRAQHLPHTQQQLRVGSSRPRPAHIPDWLPPFPDPHTYVRTDISGEPEPSYEKAREGLALLYRNTVMSLKDFVLQRSRQQQAPMMASVEEDEQKAMTNGATTIVHDPEQLKTIDPEFSNSTSEKFFFEEENEEEISLLQAEVPTFGEIIEPKAMNEPYLDPLLFDVQNESASGIRTKLPEDAGSDGNPFLRSPKMPSVLDDNLMHE
ncbi:Transcription initiation factor tfiid subunit 8 [Dirofilaria immitis]|nr:Transcription initiation factor tfiid subunit 8 [Dirofilaria immitis]